MNEEYEEFDVPITTIKNWYNEEYYMDAGYHGGYRGLTWKRFGRIHMVFNDTILKYFPTPKKVLVVGGARGLQAKCFGLKGITDVTTVDISHWAITHPVEVGLNLIEADAAEMPMFKDKEFDYVILSDLLEHLSSARVDKTLSEIQRVSSGKVFANIGREPFNRPDDSDITHLTIRPKNWWEKKLQEYFDIISFEEVQHPAWFSTGSWRVFFMEVKK